MQLVFFKPQELLWQGRVDNIHITQECLLILHVQLEKTVEVLGDVTLPFLQLKSTEGEVAKSHLSCFR